MKILKSPQKVLIIFLSVFVILSAIFIVRLEIKAASLQSQWDEHQKSLKNNEDILSKLNVFGRYVKQNVIKVDGNAIQIMAGQSSVILDNNTVNIETKGDITIGRLNNKKIGIDTQQDYIYLTHKGASLVVGTTTGVGGKKEPGILLKSPNGNMLSISDESFFAGIPGKSGPEGDYQISIVKDKGVALKKGKSIIKLDKDDINIEAKGNISIKVDQDREFGYDAQEDYIYLANKEASLVVGTTTGVGGKKEPGILLKSPNGNILSISDKGFFAGVPGKSGPEDDYKISIGKDKFVFLQKGESIIKLDKDDINIEAKGDINITSKNGNVNINGKKVNLNE